jgi:GDP-4-dehydro-6-deoxy-D-mannose reductase
MSKRVLITGAHGFVGKHLAKELHDHGYDVVSVDRSAATEPSPHVSQAYVIDLTDADAVSTIDFSTISGVIHLAGLAAVGPSFDNPKLYVETNMGIEISLFEAAKAQGATPRFVIISSGNLYDPTADLPLSETSHVAPNSPYAVSKLGQEQLGTYYGNRGFEYIIARPFNHIGPGQNLGFLLPDITKQAVEVELGKASEIKVGNLDAQRDYTDVRDIVRAYRLLLEKGTSGETYNICSGKPLSGNDILKAILKATIPTAKVTQDPARMRPSDAPVIYGDSSKLSYDTGWKPELDIQATIADVVADWRTRLS